MRGILRVLGCALVAPLLAFSLAGCERADEPRVGATVGDPPRGRALVAALGCGACHAIPQVPGARGIVGPNLDGMGQRALIGGEIANTAENLARWVDDAPSLIADTAMPDMPMTQEEARDIAAFLQTLR